MVQHKYIFITFVQAMLEPAEDVSFASPQPTRTAPHRCHLQEDGEVISQHLHGPDTTGLMKTIVTSFYWIAHTGMSVPDVRVDTRWCLVKKGLERGSPNQSKQKDSFRQQPY